MIMQMKYALAGVGAGVDDDPEAAFGDPLIAGETRGHLKNLADDRTIVRFDIKNAGEMFARNDQKMNRRSRLEVLESNDAIVPISALIFPSAIAQNRQSFIRSSLRMTCR